MSKPSEQEAISGPVIGAERVDASHAGGLRQSLPHCAIRLSELNGKRLRVILPVGNRMITVKGLAAYKPKAGLCIRLDDELSTELCIAESTWNGRIVADREHGSDFLIALEAAPAAQPLAS